MAGDSTPTLLTIAEAASLLRRSTRTIRRWARSGELPAIQVGKGTYFRTEDIISAIQQSLQKAIGIRAPGLRSRYDTIPPPVLHDGNNPLE